MADDKPIIVIKKKGGHGGHHGGAWKVAYADFVTAMMAFFMVMWLINSASDPVRQSIASYFRKPGIFQSGSGTPLQIGAAGILPDAPPPKAYEKKNSQGNTFALLDKKSGTDNEKSKGRITLKGEKDKGDGAEKGVGVKTPDNPKDFEEAKYTSHGINLEKEEVVKVADEIKKQIAESKELSQLLGIVDVKVDADGLNIEIMDTDRSSMFTLGSARILPDAESAFRKIGVILAKLPNTIDIVGHTDATPFPGKNNGYSNWELSSDRANAARRLLLAEGVTATRISSVVGRADKELKKKEAPNDASNRRITLKMRFRQTVSIDLPKDPSALDSINFEEQKYQKDEEEKIHSFSARQVLTPGSPPGQKAPEGKKTGTPEFVGKDGVIGNSPVIGPTDHFANF